MIDFSGHCEQESKINLARRQLLRDVAAPAEPRYGGGVMGIEGSGPPLPKKKMKIYAAVQRICVVV